MTPAIRVDERFNRMFAANAGQIDACGSSGCFGMRPSRFDLVSSFLLAMLLMLGTLVVILLATWMLSGYGSEPSPRVPTPTRGSVGVSAGQEDFQVPAAAEVIDLASPNLTTFAVEIALASRQLAIETDLPSEASVRRGAAAAKSVGPGGGGDVVAESQRWELTFHAADQRGYAQQLDFHGIELAAFGGGLSGIDYGSQLAGRAVARHTEDPTLEQRLYFSWIRPSPLARYEQQLLATAGIATRGRQIVKFIPSKLENRLTAIELEYAQSHGIPSSQAIAKTVFRCQAEGAGYRFVVVGQRYKRGWSSVVSGEAKN